MARPVVGVLVMAYGTPNRKEEILPYYTHIRRGRPPTPEQLQELIERYEAIGGLSQLNQISRSQAESVLRALQAMAPDVDWRLYQANKHWEPWIPDVVARMAEDGIQQAVGIVLAPQGSKMSSGAYFEQVDQALARLDRPLQVKRILSWHLEPEFVAAQVELMREGLARFPGGEPEVVFTCHSLPARILEWGDPYPEHLREMGEAIARGAGVTRFHFAYQSAGRTPEPWLGPDVRDKVAELAAAGARAVLVAAIGFVSDHLEVLYDLDIELKQAAAELGVHLERTRMLNDHPGLAQALANAVLRAARGAL
ncbi:ferrochelatase [Symbiobacterium terraclitae]|uniref:ferrochelatase n=1 Tax=Symbiobacterium terraclitae TaxID=557451 RepID=UPI0035B53AA6